MTLAPGLAATIALIVGAPDLAPAQRSGDVPVVATPRLVALCEEASVAAVAAHLGPGETTVGTRVALDHLAPAGPGARVEAAAVLQDVAGHRLTFTVEVELEGRPLARGTVVRVVVDRAAFLEKAGA